MTDVLSKRQRSFNMSRIKSFDTRPEKIVRKFLFSKGLRYRKNDKRYPGHPDIVLPKYKTVIFVNGCFWHRHKGCRYATTPSTNEEFWTNKFKKTIERDINEQSILKKMGWKVIVVWECSLRKKSRTKSLELLYKSILTNN